MDLKTMDPKKGHKVFVGKYNPNKNIFTKKVKKNHYFPLVKGYGIQEDVIQRLKKLGCSQIIIHAPSVTYMSDMKDWLHPEINVRDFGYGLQRYMPVKRMKALQTKVSEEGDKNVSH